MSKYKIWVLRISNNKNENYFKQSKPCNTCCKLLYKLGFRKIMYINNKSCIEKLDLNYEINNHLSNAQKKMSKYCKVCL